MGGGKSNVTNVRVKQGGGERAGLSVEEIRKAEKEIDRKGFENRGFGHWEFSGPYTIGASILDESGTSAGGYGRMKAYSVQTWGQAVEDISPKRIYGSLSAAKTAAKEEMKGWLPSIKKFS